MGRGRRARGALLHCSCNRRSSVHCRAGHHRLRLPHLSSLVFPNPVHGRRGEETPANSAPPQKDRPPHHESAAYGRSSKRQRHDAYLFSPSVISKDSPQKLVTPVQPPESVGSRISLCRAESVESDADSGAAPLDICFSGNESIKLEPSSLLGIDRDKIRDSGNSKDVAPFQYLSPHTFLLKRLIKPDDQVKIVKLCRQLGIGSGGFYRPVYRNGPRLRLWMMYLGKYWDLDSCSYGDTRPFDGAQPPTIPKEFRKYVQDAIQASHEFLKQRVGTANAVEELPPMSPDICLVNFCSSNGRIGLHQAMSRGLPVISFSVGDTTEFWYGDVRDEDKVSKVDLESGDILIFVDKPRRSFHGFSNTKPKTAPRWLTDETNLRPGRLNLTFRQC